MYFQEFDCLAAYQLVLFAVGICIMFAGLYVLSVESAKVAKTGRGTLSSRDLTSGARHGAVSASSNGASNGVSGLHNGPCKVSPTHRAPDAAPRRVTGKAVKPKACDKLDMSSSVMTEIFSEHACGGSVRNGVP